MSPEKFIFAEVYLEKVTLERAVKQLQMSGLGWDDPSWEKLKKTERERDSALFSSSSP